MKEKTWEGGDRSYGVPFVTKIETLLIERLQRRATKFILGWSFMDYKQRLIKLQILPFMMTFELNDIMFTIRPLKTPLQASMLSTMFHLVQRLPGLHPTTNLSSNVQGPTNMDTLIF